MNSKILTKEEKEKIERITDWLLTPIGGKVKISDDYSTIDCSMSRDGGLHYSEWKEYDYQIKVETQKGPHKYSEVFDDINDPIYLAQAAWKIAYTIWKKFNGSINSELTKKLWPPDYEKLMEI